MAVVVIIIGAFLFGSIVTAIYRYFWSENLTVEIKFKEDFVTEEMESELTETIVNKKWLFLPILQVAFETNRNLHFGEEENVSVSDRCYKRDIFSVGGYQKITRTIPFYCSKRGYYEIQDVDIITRNPLLTEKLHASSVQDTVIYGFPKRLDDAKMDISFRKIMGEIQAQKNIYEDPFEFTGIREYHPSDPMSRINWKASARSEEWMVNLYGSTNAQEMIIFLDFEEETTGLYEHIHEQQIRLAVTLAERLMEAGIPVGIISNGKDIKDDTTLKLAAGTGMQQMLSVNRALSRIDLQKKADIMERFVLEERKNMSHTQKTYLMISKNQRKKCYEAFLNLLQQGTKGFWIHMHYHGTEWNLPEYESVAVIDWEVQ